MHVSPKKRNQNRLRNEYIWEIRWQNERCRDRWSLIGDRWIKQNNSGRIGKPFMNGIQRLNAIARVHTWEYLLLWNGGGGDDRRNADSRARTHAHVIHSLTQIAIHNHKPTNCRWVEWDGMTSFLNRYICVITICGCELHKKKMKKKCEQNLVTRTVDHDSAEFVCRSMRMLPPSENPVNRSVFTWIWTNSMQYTNRIDFAMIQRDLSFDFTLAFVVLVVVLGDFKRKRLVSCNQNWYSIVKASLWSTRTQHTHTNRSVNDEYAPLK